MLILAEVGDYNEEDHQGNYINSIKLLPRQVHLKFCAQRLEIIHNPQRMSGRDMTLIDI